MRSGVKYFLGIFLLSVFACQRADLTSRLFLQNGGEVRKVRKFGSAQVVMQKRSLLKLSKSDPDCTPEKAIKKLEKVKIWVRQGRQMVQKIVDFSGFSGNGLRSDYIENAIINYKIINKYENCKSLNSMTFECTANDVEVIHPGEPVQICRKEGYSRMSLENAALVTVYGIKKVFDVLADIPEIRKKIKNLEVNILPEIERTIPANEFNQGYYLTDNAFWQNTSRSGDGYSIVVLPHSNELSDIFKDHYLWEQNGVLAHETGHHIFNQFDQNIRRIPTALHDLDDKTDGFEKAMVDIELKVFGSILREVDNNTVISAMNESVADLISYLVHKKINDSLGLMILGNTEKLRDVKALYTDDNELKSLNKNVLKHFYSSQKTSPKYRISADHQDIHTIGAFLATGLIQSMVEKNMSIDKQILTVIDWSRKINLIGAAHLVLTVPDLLQKIALQGILSMQGADGVSEIKGCEKIGKMFPVYYQKWKKNSQFDFCTEQQKE